MAGDGQTVKESAMIGDQSDSDDDWEGVETTELDEAFRSATAFVAAIAADRTAQKVSNKLKLQLNGLHKIATEGPCSTPPPWPLKMTARVKWQAWKNLGVMPPEEAMEKCIDIITELFPFWATGTAIKKDDDSNNAPTASSRGPVGPVFSYFVHEEEPGHELKLDAIHAFAQEGADEEKLRECIENDAPLNLKDSEGCTPLHWAVDHGHMNATALLLKNNADVNAKDDEGQTALDHACVCERAAIAKLLVEHGADTRIKDNEGNTLGDLRKSRCVARMQHVANAAG